MSNQTDHAVASPSASSGGVRLPAAGGEVVCPGCSARSPRASRFCGQCGDRLWDPCAKCGELNSVAERYCLNCGGDLQSLLAATRAEVEQKLAEAEKLAEFGRLVDAMKLLEAVPLADHSALLGLGERISGKIAEYHDRREEVIRSATPVLEAVKRLIDESRFADALAEARRIPPALRNAELARLHDATEQKVQRAAQLREQVKAGVAAKRYDDLHAVALQLAKLDPHDPWLNKLLPQLAQWQAKADARRATHCLRAANEALSQNAYRKAEALLGQAPSVNEPAINKALTVARERVWVASFVASTPYCTESAVAAAERLVKLQPTDDTARRLAAQLAQHHKASLASGQDVPAPWAKPAGEGPLGPLPELCPLPKSLRQACKPIKRSAHDFAIAYGLALQGAGAAPIALNLMPAEKGRWRDKLRIGGGKKREAAAWGVDLGGGALKAVCVAQAEGPDGPCVVRHVERVAYAGVEPVAVQKGDSGLASPVLAALQKLASKHDLSGQRVVFSLSGPQTLGRFFELPAPSAAKFQQAVEFEVRQRVPLPAEDIVFDYHAEPLPRSEGEKGDSVERRWVTLVAVSRNQIAARVAPLAELGCEVLVMSSPVALLNAALGAGGVLAGREQAGAGAAIIDVGGSSSSIAVVTRSKTWFRGVHFGADSMVASLAKSLNTDRKTARNLYRQPAAAPLMHQVHESLTPAYEEFTDQLKRSLELCRADTGVRVERILVTGSEAHALGLMRYLRCAR